MKQVITKTEVKFWLVVIGVLLTGVIAFVRLQEKVSAMEQDDMELSLELDTNLKILLDVRERVIRIEENIEFIKDDLK